MVPTTYTFNDLNLAGSHKFCNFNCSAAKGRLRKAHVALESTYYSILGHRVSEGEVLNEINYRAVEGLEGRGAGVHDGKNLILVMEGE